MAGIEHGDHGAGGRRAAGAASALRWHARVGARTPEKTTGDVHVACAGGELVTLSAAGGPPKRIVHVARDLRDVVVTPLGLVVSTFRDADIIRLAKDGSVQAQSAGIPSTGRARVAWRMIASPSSASTGTSVRADEVDDLASYLESL